MLEMLELARANLENLRRNPYPGQGIIVGRDGSGENRVQVYWIMGRSENSRNRVFGQDLETGRVFTEAVDPAKVKDPSLIIYNAMMEWNDCFVVSNGEQTDFVINAFVRNWTLFDAMYSTSYEPDAPNYTPRISAVCFARSGHFQMAINRKSPWSEACDRHLYCFGKVQRGFGFCLTTYSGDGSPLPAFQGEPYPLLLKGDNNIKEVTGILWDVLNPENRVALAVKFINRDSGKSTIEIINKYAKV